MHIAPLNGCPGFAHLLWLPLLGFSGGHLCTVSEVNVAYAVEPSRVHKWKEQIAFSSSCLHCCYFCKTLRGDPWCHGTVWQLSGSSDGLLSGLRKDLMLDTALGGWMIWLRWESTWLQCYGKANVSSQSILLLLKELTKGTVLVCSTGLTENPYLEF